jgi:hypothetical protein
MFGRKEILMQSKILRYAAISLATLGVGMGVAAADSASIDTTGPHSRNNVDIDNNNQATLDNNNRLRVNNDVDQHASSGDARVSNNTNGGSAQSGDATNDNSLDTSVSVSNGNGGGNWSDFFGSGGTDASIGTTGPNSNNRIDVDNRNTLRITNTNNVNVRNDVDQRATSGDARVSNNTFGGDATSGDASNTNSTTTSVDISN